MTKTALDIKLKNVKNEELAVFFIGQAGFVIKDSSGKLVAVDLYLSDCCERYFGFKRLIPKLLAPDELAFDIIIATHAHYDHFDIDAMPVLMSNSNTVLYTSEEGLKECQGLGIKKEQVKLMTVGSTHFEKGFKIEAVYCDHGELARDAVGILLKVEDKCIYIAGDTAYRPEKMEQIAKQEIDLMIMPINGAFGNLNEEESVLLTKMINPKLVVPCHFGNFSEHGGNPELFVHNINRILPNQKYKIMALGESIII